MIALWTIGLLAVFASSIAIFLPLWNPRSQSPFIEITKKLRQLYFSKNSFLDQLKELELDFSQGKIEAHDHETLRTHLLLELQKVYKEIDQLEKGPELEKIQRELSK